MASASVLLPDETHCKSELGAILYRDRKAYAFSAEILNTAEPAGFFGHVEYNIGICMDPVDIHKFEWRRFEVSTRFRDLNRLYHQLQLIHKQLYLKDSFPAFAETRLFGSTAPEIIEERKKYIVGFLNFVLRNDVLSKARVFQVFLDGGREKQQEDVTQSEMPAASTDAPVVEATPPATSKLPVNVDDLD